MEESTDLNVKNNLSCIVSDSEDELVIDEPNLKIDENESETLEKHIKCKPNKDIPSDKGEETTEESETEEYFIACNENDTSVDFYIENAPIKSKKKLEAGNSKFSGDFRCKLCKYTTHVEKFLRIHMGIKHKNQVQQCNECPFKTKLRAAFNRHVKDHFREDGYQCRHCSLRKDSQWGLKNHEKIHFSVVKQTIRSVKPKSKSSKTDQGPICCPICPFSTNILNSLILHMKLHATVHEQMENVLRCPLCGFFTKQLFFSRHMRHHLTVKKDKLKAQLRNALK